MHLRALALAIPLALSAVAAASTAHAFCGFYVSGADQMFSDNLRI